MQWEMVGFQVNEIMIYVGESMSVFVYACSQCKYTTAKRVSWNKNPENIKQFF